MAFIQEPEIAARADDLWRLHGLMPGFDIEQLVDDLGLSLLWEAITDTPGEHVLGQLDPSEARIVLNERHIESLEANGGRLRRFTIAHEVGHWVFHAELARSGALTLFEGRRIWCRSGVQDPVERQAEMFAARLLMPRHHVNAIVPKARWGGWGVVYKVAEAFVVSPTAMMIRLEELGLGHRLETGEPKSGRRPVPGQAQLF